MAGVPASVLLVLTSLTGLFLGKRVASREDVIDSGKPAKLIVLSVATGLVSLVFWLWACVRCVIVSFDLGSISFFLALCASLYGAGALDSLVPLNAEAFRVSACSKGFFLCVLRRLRAAGYGSVVANYVLGLLVVSDLGLRLYFLAGAAAWSAALATAVLIVREGGVYSVLSPPQNADIIV